jgi:hypothetical protein
MRRKLKKILFALFFHIFPFGWFYSIFGGIIFFWSLYLLYPYVRNYIIIEKGEIHKIGEPHYNPHSDGQDPCALTVYVKIKNQKIIECTELCEYFINDSLKGKIVTVKFDYKDKFGNSSHNKILLIESQKINSYLGASEMATLILFLWGGLFLYIAFRDIKNEYKRQIEKEEKRKNEPPSQFNYDKY